MADQPQFNVTEAQQKALDAGTHVLDPVHGFVPKLPIATEDPAPIQETVTPASDAPTQAEQLKAESAAVKQTEKDHR